ncbi:MAG: type II toxin-antitoxin system Phd/YefM family antitoxin [Blastocatellales bacterium]
MNTATTSLNCTIELADFKARCLEVLEQLVAPGLIVTKEGRPFAQITPLTAVNNEPLIGSMKGQIAIHGDIFSTGIEWDAQS